MSEFSEYMQQRFPEMKPITSAPTMFSINGIGTTCYGERDYDHQTGSYVKTLWITVIFIPIIALSAYRVIKDPDGDGWYFLGKVPLKGWQKIWNLLLLLAIVGGVGGIYAYNRTQTPEYKAAQKLDNANLLRGKGELLQAAKLYQELMTTSTPSRQPAQEQFVGLLDHPELKAEQAAVIYGMVLDQMRQGRVKVPDFEEKTLALADKISSENPSQALELMDLVKRSSKNPQPITAKQTKLLEDLVAKEPQSVNHASRLAELYEEAGKTALCEKLLEPHAKNLGTREAAAVMARLLLNKGKFQEAVDLLRPYVDSRLSVLINAQQTLEQASNGERQRLLNLLRNGDAIGFDYNRFKAAGKAEQQKMVNDYIDGFVDAMPQVKEATDNIRKNGKVVQGALDLGLALLQLGQASRDPDKRKELLTEAEKRFLSIREFAGKSEDYLLSLGQVYYWLGKHTDGKKQFDQLLEQRNNEPRTMYLVSKTLRDVGETDEARKLCEQVYKVSTDEKVKHEAAAFRAVMRKDLDDEIEWYGKADPNDPEVKSGLAQAKGHKAMRDNKTQEAIQHFQTAIKIFDSQRETFATLNNAALVHFDLFTLTGQQEDFVRGTEKMDRAIALQPTDSILLSNGASTLQEASLRNLIGEAIDLQALQQRANISHLTYLTDTPEQYAAWTQKLKANPGMIKARNYFEKSMLLAPKNIGGYNYLQSLYARIEDAAALKAMADRVEKIEFDRTTALAQYQETLSGVNTAKYLDEGTKAIARIQEIIAKIKNRKSATFAIAVGQLVDTSLMVYGLGGTVNAEELVQLAEEAVKAAPSMGSRRTERNARLTRAFIRLQNTPGPFQTLAKQYFRTVGSDLVDFGLFRNGELAKQLLADSDMKFWLTSLRDDLVKYPINHSESSWATLLNFDPTTAKTFGEQLRQRELWQIGNRLEARLNINTVSVVLDRFYRLKLDKKDAEAEKMLDEARQSGLPIPKI